MTETVTYVLQTGGSVTEVSIDVDVSPDEVYALVSDLPRMGEWSPECTKCRWLGGATTATPGARFKGYNRIGRRRWTTVGRVVAAEPGREVSFDIHTVGGLPVARWTYRIAPDGRGGCTVTETWEDRRNAVTRLLGQLATGVTDRAAHNEAGMRATLERIKATAEGARTS